jgi:hypothetical protein
MKIIDTFKMTGVPEIWVIESRNRGAYIGFGENSSGKHVPKFRYSISLKDTQVVRFVSKNEVEKALDGIKKHCADACVRKIS